MAKVGRTGGTITISEAGAVPVVEASIASVTPTVTHQLKGQKVIAAGTSLDVLNLGGIVNATLVHLRFFNEATDAAQNATVSIEAGPEVIPACIEFLFVGNDVAVGITAIKITTIAGNDTRVEYVIAGTI